MADEYEQYGRDAGKVEDAAEILKPIIRKKLLAERKYGDIDNSDIDALVNAEFHNPEMIKGIKSRIGVEWARDHVKALEEAIVEIEKKNTALDSLKFQLNRYSAATGMPAEKFKQLMAMYATQSKNFIEEHTSWLRNAADNALDQGTSSQFTGVKSYVELFKEKARAGGIDDPQRIIEYFNKRKNTPGTPEYKMANLEVEGYGEIRKMYLDLYNKDNNKLAQNIRDAESAARLEAVEREAQIARINATADNEILQVRLEGEQKKLAALQAEMAEVKTKLSPPFPSQPTPVSPQYVNTPTASDPASANAEPVVSTAMVGNLYDRARAALSSAVDAADRVADKVADSVVDLASRSSAAPVATGAGKPPALGTPANPERLPEPREAVNPLQEAAITYALEAVVAEIKTEIKEKPAAIAGVLNDYINVKSTEAVSIATKMNDDQLRTLPPETRKMLAGKLMDALDSVAPDGVAPNETLAAQYQAKLNVVGAGKLADDIQAHKDAIKVIDDKIFNKKGEFDDSVYKGENRLADMQKDLTALQTHADALEKIKELGGNTNVINPIMRELKATMQPLSEKIAEEQKVAVEAKATREAVNPLKEAAIKYAAEKQLEAEPKNKFANNNALNFNSSYELDVIVTGIKEKPATHEALMNEYVKANSTQAVNIATQMSDDQLRTLPPETQKMLAGKLMSALDAVAPGSVAANKDLAAQYQAKLDVVGRGKLADDIQAHKAAIEVIDRKIFTTSKPDYSGYKGENRLADMQKDLAELKTHQAALEKIKERGGNSNVINPIMRELKDTMQPLSDKIAEETALKVAADQKIAADAQARAVKEAAEKANPLNIQKKVMEMHIGNDNGKNSNLFYYDTNNVSWRVVGIDEANKQLIVKSRATSNGVSVDDKSYTVPMQNAELRVKKDGTNELIEPDFSLLTGRKPEAQVATQSVAQEVQAHTYCAPTQAVTMQLEQRYPTIPAGAWNAPVETSVPCHAPQQHQGLLAKIFGGRGGRGG